MKVYREDIVPNLIANNVAQMPYLLRADGKWFTKGGDEIKIINDENYYVAYSGPSVTTQDGWELETGKTYRLYPSFIASSLEKHASYKEVVGRQEVVDIHEMTYTGSDMGERKITAVIKHKSPIDFRLGDYVEMQTNDLVRSNLGAEGGTDLMERFYVYILPSIKKTARNGSVGDAFETTVVFYPRQYELACVQMRDIIQLRAQDQVPILYTGFDSVTFVGGAKMLMDRIMAVLQEAYHDNAGQPLWDYQIADGVNEEINNALEQFQFSFSQNTVMDALLELNNKDTLNTSFFINERTIYVGFKRPYFCGVDELGAIKHIPFNFEYGKTSHLPSDINHGCLYDITKVVSDKTPITKLFAYGAARNLNRYYCSDRIKSGRYVNKLMLPSFDDDGQTDFILSEEGVKRFGVREGSKTFEDIYPSLRFMTYGDLRQIKYCIKIKGSGITTDYKDADGRLDKTRAGDYAYPVARVQCYKVTDDGTGKNTIVECAPPKDMTIIVHATGKIVKCRLYGGATNEEAIRKQMAADYKVPTTDGEAPAQDLSNVIPGACFCVHDFKYDQEHWVGYVCNSRDEWFEKPDWNDDNPNSRESAREKEIELAQIEYVDTFWLTDLYWFSDYDQTFFNRDAVSAWCWPRTSEKSPYPNETIVNEIVAVEPIKIVDTSLALQENTIQKTFDVYLKDVGFRFDEQNDFGEMVFVYDDVVLSFLDGQLCGREYKFVLKNQYNLNAICAYNDDGTLNDDFFASGQYEPAGQQSELALQAFREGAYWRVTCAREVTDDSLGLILPMKGSNFGEINAKKGDHVVFLDLYMPDIYIHAAENRLLKEAQKFLDANDNCETNYNISFDKVRPLQIPLYGIEMREGLNMRIIDEDLEIATEYNKKVLLDSKEGVSGGDYIGRYYIRENHKNGSVHVNSTDQSKGHKFEMYFSEIERQMWDMTGGSWYGTICVYYKGVDYLQCLDWYKETAERLQDGTWHMIGYIRNTFFSPNTIRLYFERDKDFEVGLLLSRIPSINKFVRVNYPIDFIAGRRYSITLDETTELNGESAYIAQNALTLIKSTGEVFTPECSVSQIITADVPEGMKRYKFEFELGHNFDDNTPYYVQIEFKSDYERTDETYAQVILHNITMQNIESAGLNEKCIDMKVESVNIKIRKTNDGGSNREISATLKETTSASAWAELNTKVNSVATESNQNRVTSESLANSARQHYRELLMLRDTIFDPDGKCDQTFLHVMMMQIGADSMNYGLYPAKGRGKDEYTHQDNIGTLHWGMVAVDNSGQWGAKFYENALKHYVFVQEPTNGGNWDIARMEDTVQLGTENEKPVYFVALKCSRTTKEGQWVVDTNQHMTDEDPDYWYFNFGIISFYNGEYHFSETRGNAYMYGDSLICGKITSMDKNCWFDLTRGEFVLGNTPNGAALSYIDGVLTVKGTVEGIGGENLCSEIKQLYEIEDIFGSGLLFNVLYPLSGVNEYGAQKTFAQGRYVASAYKIEAIATRSGGIPVPVTASAIVVRKDGNNYIDMSGDLYGDEKYSTFVLEEESQLYLRVVARAQEQCDVSKLTIEDFMLQLGTTPTTYHPYVENAVDIAQSFYREAIQGSTEVQGGLIMTNILALKDQYGNVNAGMSGLRDDGMIPDPREGHTGETVRSEGVTLWGGGSYNDALKQAMGLLDEVLKLPILLTKTGANSRIGCFEVIDRTTVVVHGYNGDEIEINAGNLNIAPHMIIRRQGEECIRISSDEIKTDISQDIRIDGKIQLSQTFNKVEPGYDEIELSKLTVYNSDGLDLVINGGTVEFSFSARLYISGSTFEKSGTFRCGLYIDNYALGTSAFYTATYNIIGITATISLNMGYDGTIHLSPGQHTLYVKILNFTPNSRDPYTGYVIGKANLFDFKDTYILGSDVLRNMVNIGRNGVEVIDAAGKFTRILNHKGVSYVQMQGLPKDTDQNVETGQLCIGGLGMKNDSFLMIKN